MRTGAVPIDNAGVGRIGRIPLRQARAPQQRVRRFETAPDIDTREQRHRVRNLLGNVQAIASISARSAESIDRFVHGLNERIVALGSVQELLAGGVDAVDLRKLVETQLDHVARAGSAKLDGPSVEVPASIAVALDMAIHELKANALEFGSLSCRDGMLLVRWRLEEEGERLLIDWLERGGPAASGPSRIGFGTRFLDRLLGERFRVERSFGSEGLSATIAVSLSGD